MNKTEYKPTWKNWLMGAIACGLLIAFLVWIQSWWGIIALPFVFDAYVTKYIRWDWWKDIEDPVVRGIMSWVDAIVFALVAVYFVNVYFFQNYVIPSSSLEKSLLVGDYLVVSKMSYGPRVPQTPLHAPLCQHTLPFGWGKSYIEWPQWEYKRVSPKQISLNDIVVFNYPAGDTVAMNMQNADYYGLCKSLYLDNVGYPTGFDSLSTLQKYRFYNYAIQTASDAIKQNPQQFGEVTWRPVDRRENYVKRCVGLPGQTLEIRDHIIYLDGKANREPRDVQYNYIVKWKGRMAKDDPFIKEHDISYEDLYGRDQYGMANNPDIAACETVLPLTESARKALASRTDLVESITYCQQPSGEHLYPLNADYGWSVDNYGPIWIPQRGKSIDLNLDNLPIYERPIRIYEGNDLRVTDDGQILINGKAATRYTFKMDYYWMQGDNRHNSADSRFWGFVPEDHIVGKPIMIWLSTNKDKSIFDLGYIRWNRIFSLVKNHN